MLLCDNVLHMARVMPKTQAMRMLEGTPMHRAQIHMMQDFAERLKHATRFVLDDAVVESACHVVLSRPSSMLEALRLVRVPLPLMWVEWSEDARRQIRKHLDIVTDNDRPLPDRFGFLITANDQGTAGVTEYCWKHSAASLNDGKYQEAGITIAPDEGVNIASKMTVFDFSRLDQPSTLPPDAEDSDMFRRWGRQPKEIDALRHMDNCGRNVWTPSGQNLLNAFGLMTPWAVEEVAAAQDADVEGEFLQVISTLILLNARNGTQSREVTHAPKLNKARVARGKAPLLEHRVITMRLSPGEVKDSRNGGAGRLTSPRRSHLVMGHYVTRAGKVFWRRAHHRGGKQPGSVGPKTYKVVA